MNRIRLSTLTAVSLLALLLLLRCGGAILAPYLDLTFGSNAKVSTDFAGSHDEAYAVALQTDGKIVVAGKTKAASGIWQFALARYNSDGSLDTSFNGTGKVATSFGADRAEAYGVAIQIDGKIVAGGLHFDGSVTRFALARYNTDGTLDTAFGTLGLQKTAIGSTQDEGRAIALQTDGKIILVGSSKGAANHDFAVARYKTDGTLDSTAFNVGTGFVTTPILASDDFGKSVVIQTDGKIVVGGSTKLATGYTRFALARYNTDGTLDTTFDGDGKVVTLIDTASNDTVQGLALQSDGNIVAGGVTTTTSVDNVAVARYETDGSADITFDTDGKVTASFGSSGGMANAAALAPGLRILIGGFANGATHDFALMRFSPLGVLDLSLNASGIATVDFNTSQDEAYAIAVQTNGRIILVGRTYNGTDFDFALVRYLP